MLYCVSCCYELDNINDQIQKIEAFIIIDNQNTAPFDCCKHHVKDEQHRDMIANLYNSIRNLESAIPWDRDQNVRVKSSDLIAIATQTRAQYRNALQWNAILSY